MRTLLLVSLLLTAASGVAAAPDEDPFVAPRAAPGSPGVATAESRYHEGLTFGKNGDWLEAEKAYRQATRLNTAFPEAWNGLGFALRKLGRYDESIRAYHEVLRLRPKYPQALEYLGEAKAVLERLRPLDRKVADELATLIAKASKR